MGSKKKKLKKLLSMEETYGLPSAGQAPRTELRSYLAPFDGLPLLACRKCQKKLKGDSDLESLAKLKKTLKKIAKRDEHATEIRVIPVSCLKLCPKKAVTIITQTDMASPEPRVSLLRSEADVEMLYAEYASAHFTAE